MRKIYSFLPACRVQAGANWVQNIYEVWVDLGRQCSKLDWHSDLEFQVKMGSFGCAKQKLRSYNNDFDHNVPWLRLFIRKIDWIALILQHMSFVAWRISRKSIVLVAALTLYMSWFAYFDFLEDIFRSVSSLFIRSNSFFFWLFQLLFSRFKKNIITYIPSLVFVRKWV